MRFFCLCLLKQHAMKMYGVVEVYVLDISARRLNLLALEFYILILAHLYVKYE